MKYLDIAVQTLLLLAGLSMIVLSARQPWLVTALWVQCLLGPWQYISSLIAAMTGSRYWRSKRKHLAFASVYMLSLLLLLGAPYIFPFAHPPATGWLASAFLLLPPWALTVYYYIISWKCALKQREKQSNFLPHTGF